MNGVMEAKGIKHGLKYLFAWSYVKWCPKSSQLSARNYVKSPGWNTLLRSFT